MDKDNSGKYLWTAKVGDKGQIVIPKEARDIFNIKPRDTLLLLGDEERGIAIVPYNEYAEFAHAILRAGKDADKDEK